MGGVATTTSSLSGLGTALSVGTGVASLVNSSNQQKAQASQIAQQQESAVNSRANLLEQQLATKKASLSALGISQDGSAAASQTGMINDAYDDISDINSSYNYQYTTASNSYNQNLLSGISSLSNKVLI